MMFIYKVTFLAMFGSRQCSILTIKGGQASNLPCSFQRAHYHNSQQWMQCFSPFGKNCKELWKSENSLSFKKKENHSNPTPYIHQLPTKEEVLGMPIWVYLGIIHFPKRLKTLPNHKVDAVFLRVPSTINYHSQELRGETQYNYLEIIEMFYSCTISVLADIVALEKAKLILYFLRATLHRCVRKGWNATSTTSKEQLGRM